MPSRVPPTGGMASVTSIGCAEAAQARAAASPVRHASPSTIIPYQRPAISSAAAIGPGSRLAERPHRVEQVREAGEALRHRRARLRVGRHRMAERDAYAGGGERGDEAVRHLLGRERHAA